MAVARVSSKYVQPSIQRCRADDNASLVVLRGLRNGGLNITLSEEAEVHRIVCLPESGRASPRIPTATHGENEMTWKTPTIIEIALGAEINCYACAELK